MTTNIKITKMIEGNYVADEEKPAKLILSVYKSKIFYCEEDGSEFPDDEKACLLHTNALLDKKLKENQRLKELNQLVGRKVWVDFLTKAPFKYEPDQYWIVIHHPNRGEDGNLPILYKEKHKLKSFDEAIALGQEMLANNFSHVETKFEKIKYIPHYKKGKRALKLRPEENQQVDEQIKSKIKPDVVTTAKIKPSKKKEKVSEKKVKTLKSEKKVEKKKVVAVSPKKKKEKLKKKK